jgi:hypothetical protein
MFVDLKDVKVDAHLEKEGVWVELDDETAVKVSFFGGDYFNREIDRRMKRTGFRQLRNDYDARTKATIDVMVESGIHDWRGVKEHGAEVPFTKDNCRRVLTQYPVFRQEISVHMQDVSHFQKEQEEADTKNSVTLSAGPPAGAETLAS